MTHARVSNNCHNDSYQRMVSILLYDMNLFAFCLKEKVSFVNSSFIYFYQYRLMDSHFIQYHSIVMHYHHYLSWHYYRSWFGQWETFEVGTLFPFFDIFSHSLSIFLPWQKVPDSLCAYSAPDLEWIDVPFCDICIYQSGSGCLEHSLLLGHHSSQAFKWTDLRNVYMYIHIHMSKSFYICLYVD